MQVPPKLAAPRQETGLPTPELPVPPTPVPAPDPDLPAPIPVPIPDPEPPSPWTRSDEETGGELVQLPLRSADIEIVLKGSTAIVTGVVRELEVRRHIVEAVSSLAWITAVEDHLRLPALPAA
jgi:hypothetical protein